MKFRIVVYFSILAAIIGGQIVSAQADDDWLDCGGGIKLNLWAIRSIQSLFSDKILIVAADEESEINVTVAEYLDEQLIKSCRENEQQPEGQYTFKGEQSSQNFNDIDLTPGLWSFEVSPPAMLSYMSIKTDSANCVESYMPEMIMLDATLQVKRDCTAYINISYTNMEMSPEYTFTIQKLN